MDGSRFDNLAKALGAGARSRRSVVREGAVGFALALFGVGRRGAAGGAGRRRCRPGAERCRRACCAESEECHPSLKTGRWPKRTCCPPENVFVLDTDYEDEACCPPSYVCVPGDPGRDGCCDPRHYACLPGVGCCRKSNVWPDGRCGCGGGPPCGDEVLDGPTCCEEDERVCGFCHRTIRIRRPV